MTAYTATVEYKKSNASGGEYTSYTVCVALCAHLRALLYYSLFAYTAIYFSALDRLL